MKIPRAIIKNIPKSWRKSCAGNLLLRICYLSAIECHKKSNSPGTRMWHQQNSFENKRRTRKRVESGEKSNCAVIIGSISKKEKRWWIADGERRIEILLNSCAW